MTKKIAFFSLLLSFLFVSPSHAQYYYNERNLSLGLVFNPNIGWLSYSDSDVYKSDAKFGYAYGLLADIGFARNYFFSTGLTINTLYTDVNSMMYHTVSSTPSATDTKNFRLQYVEVPLSIKLKTNEGNLGRFYGQFGFTAGVKVSGKEKFDNTNKYNTISGDDIFRLGLIIGTGAEWRVSNSLSAVTGVTYNNGFTRTMKEGSPKLSYVSLNLGLLF